MELSLTLRSGHFGRTTLARRGPWIDPGCCSWRSSMVDDTSVSTRPLSDSPTDCFRVPTAQRSHGSSGDCGGLSGCTVLLLQLVYHSHRYCAPAERRTNVVCRFPPPLHLTLHFCTFVVFERRRHCCPLMPGCPTDFGLQCCAQASHAA